ncbi:MAG: Holliday junction resolvase RuvX [Steroidobacteraceae bacterium]
MPDGGRVVIAFDVGKKRIGIAAGNTVTSTATERSTVAVGQQGPDWTAIDAAVRDIAPALAVIGLPYNVDGTPGRLAPLAAAFGAEFERRYGLPVEYVDERYSSAIATEELSAARARGQMRRRVRREDIDRIAARIVLERWLNGAGRKS